MPQDRESGARANAWGRSTARLVAEKLGATDMAHSSNECTLGSRRIVIKCARPRTSSIGVSFKMLQKLHLVVGAFQRHDRTFELWSLTPAQFESAMQHTRSLGASVGKVGIVKRAYFQERGESLGLLRLPTDD
jgi:hypothetical protein